MGLGGIGAEKSSAKVFALCSSPSAAATVEDFQSQRCCLTLNVNSQCVHSRGNPRSKAKALAKPFKSPSNPSLQKPIEPFQKLPKKPQALFSNAKQRTPQTLKASLSKTLVNQSQKEFLQNFIGPFTKELTFKHTI